MDELLTITEAAELLGVHTETLRRWDRENKLVAVKINDRGDRRYKKSDLESFMNSDLQIGTHSGYKLYWRGNGFISMSRRFAVIGKVYAVKESEFIGFAFIAAGLTLLTDTDKKETLEDIAIAKVKEYLEKATTYDGDTFTFEYINGDFDEVFNPEWWEDPYRKVLTNGLAVEVSDTHPITLEQKAWRVILNYKSKSNGTWFTTPFGNEGMYREYYVFIDGNELIRHGMGNSAKNAEIYALNFGIRRFDETKDIRGGRSIARITENKVACFDNSCRKNASLPNNLLGGDLSV